jgi:hypothetical protein
MLEELGKWKKLALIQRKCLDNERSIIDKLILDNARLKLLLSNVPRNSIMLSNTEIAQLVFRLTCR